LGAGSVRYEIAARARGVAVAGVGLAHRLVSRLGLVKELNRNVRVLKRHAPYWESDHVLTVAYTLLAGGTCLEDIELLRRDEAFLDLLGAERMPDPTTAGDFLRRFEGEQITDLMEVINRSRLRVWAKQPAAFFEQAVIDADGTFVPTSGECKEGMDINYKGQWGHHPLLVSLANTAEPLFVVNRAGNRPSHEGAAVWLERGVELCRKAGFRRILLRGDTDFTQTAHLDRWDDAGVEFLFGIDAMRNLRQQAESLPAEAWKRLERPAKYEVKTEPRARPENVKERLIRERGFENLRLLGEEVAEFAYQPTACRRPYRVVVVRKNLTRERGEQALFDEIRLLFYITNDWNLSAEEVVLLANARCDQENLIKQLKNGVHALKLPSATLESNWAYMVIASLAWTLKAWLALLLPEGGRWAEKHGEEKRAVLRMEFKRFVNAFIRLPAQVVRQGRSIVLRLLGWNPWLHVLLRAVQAVG
jgi:hypothetical protein